jgi:hypothetical protein
VLRRIFGPKPEEVTGENCVMSYVICTIHQILLGTMRWAGNVGCMGQKRNTCKILIGKPEGKKSWKT